MDTYSLCLAWNWEYDQGFANLLEQACISRGLSLLQVTETKLESTLWQLQTGELRFGTLLDRASDSTHASSHWSIGR